MTDRMQVFSTDELKKIHDASMDVLMSNGIVFKSDLVVELFKRNGFKTDGYRVYFSEADICAALENAPSSFRLQARNPEHNVSLGGDDFVFLPTGGAPNITLPSRETRLATMADYEKCCKLVQTSDQLDMNGLLMVQPSDLSANVAHLYILLANILFCDKAHMGAAMNSKAAVDCLELAKIVWGGEEELKKQAVMATIINATSPLTYTEDEADSIVLMASSKQALVITNLVMAGSSGPISLPSLLAQSNAEILAGVVLAQLAGPGTPVVYGSVSAPADMRTLNSAVGAPEAVVLASATIQMAQFYNLPCRTGGMVTNAHCLDAQAAAEGTLLMSTAVRNGANFILHACGQLGSYISMSFEKWLFDEEVCRMLRRIITALDVSVDSIDVQTIKDVGSGGNYLMHSTTFEHCRNLYQPELFTRSDYQTWKSSGARDVTQEAHEMLSKRLQSYVKPPIDAGLERELQEFVRRREKEID